MYILYYFIFFLNHNVFQAKYAFLFRPENIPKRIRGKTRYCVLKKTPVSPMLYRYDLISLIICSNIKIKENIEEFEF